MQYPHRPDSMRGFRNTTQSDRLAPLMVMWVILGSLAFAHWLIQLTLLLKPIEEITTLLTIDDTYYYLLTAWNLKAVGFATFDGINSTNGVQFLWFTLLAGLAYLVSTKTALLYFAIALCITFNVLCYLVIGAIGHLLRRPVFALLMALFWSLHTFYVKQAIFGMENALHALVFWVVVWQLIRFFVSIQPARRGPPDPFEKLNEKALIAQAVDPGVGRNLLNSAALSKASSIARVNARKILTELPVLSPNILALALILVLNSWARLDAAIFSVVLYLFAITIWFMQDPHPNAAWHNHTVWLILSIILAGLGFVIQSLGFFWLGGSPYPVSALVKTLDAEPGLPEDALAQLLRYIEISLPPNLFIIELPTIEKLPLSTELIVSVSAPLLVIVTFHMVYRFDTGRRILRQTWYGLLTGYIVYHFVILMTGAQYEGYFTWYRSPLYIFWLFTFSLALINIIDSIPKKADRLSRK
ncbi:hypothetical protein KFU94_31490 [Chloroflexi bacterium TSY]|nr:hypothetical protein [Chloroflexi bacterium TSY]